MRHANKTGYGCNYVLQFPHNLIGMHRNKYCFDYPNLTPAQQTSPMSAPNSSQQAEAAPPVPMEVANAVENEVDKGDKVVESMEPTSDLELSQVSEDNPELATYLAKLEKKVATNKTLSTTNLWKVSQMRGTYLGLGTRVLRLERDVVRG